MAEAAKKSNTEESASDIRADLETLRSDIERLSSAMGELVEHQMAFGREAIREARGTLDEHMTESKDWMETTVRKRPARSLSAAIGLGLLVGFLLARRH